MARTFTMSALCALILSGLCWAAANPASYVEGTVASIPSDTQGTLDLSHPETLHFQYGATSFQVPYDKITGYHLGREGFGIDKVKRTLLPFLSKEEYLTINFQDDSSSNSQTMVLRRFPKQTRLST